MRNLRQPPITRDEFSLLSAKDTTTLLEMPLPRRNTMQIALLNNITRQKLNFLLGDVLLKVDVRCLGRRVDLESELVEGLLVGRYFLF